MSFSHYLFIFAANLGRTLLVTEKIRVKFVSIHRC